MLPRRRPHKIEGVARPALLSKWSSLAYLREAGPTSKVEVSLTTDGLLRGTVEEHETVMMEFGRQFLNQIADPADGRAWRRKPSQLHYHLAQCPLTHLPLLLRDAPPPAWLPAVPEAANLWFAIGATESGLHYDAYDNLLLVVRGLKRVLLAPPAATALLTPRPAHMPSGNHSLCSPQELQAQRAPAAYSQGQPQALCDVTTATRHRLRRRNRRPPAASTPTSELRIVSVRPFTARRVIKTLLPKLLAAGAMTIEARAGEAIFIPEGWWHRVSSPEEITIAVNYWWKGPSAQLLEGDDSNARDDGASDTVGAATRSVGCGGSAPYLLRRAFEELVSSEQQRELHAALGLDGCDEISSGTTADTLGLRSLGAKDHSRCATGEERCGLVSSACMETSIGGCEGGGAERGNVCLGHGNRDVGIDGSLDRRAKRGRCGSGCTTRSAKAMRHTGGAASPTQGASVPLAAGEHGPPVQRPPKCTACAEDERRRASTATGLSSGGAEQRGLVKGLARDTDWVLLEGRQLLQALWQRSPMQVVDQLGAAAISSPSAVTSLLLKRLDPLGAYALGSMIEQAQDAACTQCAARAAGAVDRIVARCGDEDVQADIRERLLLLAKQQLDVAAARVLQAVLGIDQGLCVS